MLTRWGVNEAAKLGVPVFLQPSEGGHGLYLKSGFRDVEEPTLDMSRWGVNELLRTWAMVHKAHLERLAGKN